MPARAKASDTVLTLHAENSRRLEKLEKSQEEQTKMLIQQGEKLKQTLGNGTGHGILDDIKEAQKEAAKLVTANIAKQEQVNSEIKDQLQALVFQQAALLSERAESKKLIGRLKVGAATSLGSLIAWAARDLWHR